MKWLYRFQLRHVVTTALLLGGLLGSVTIYLVELNVARQQMLEEQGRYIRGVLNSLQGSVNRALQQDNADEIQRVVVEASAALPNLVGTMVVDDWGDVQYASRLEFRGLPLVTLCPYFDPDVASRTLLQQEIILVEDVPRRMITGYVPVHWKPLPDEVRPSRKGLIYASLDIHVLLQQAEQRALMRALESFALLGLLGLFGLLFFQVAVNRRVQRIVRTVERVRLGEMGVRTGVSGHDELGQIAAALDGTTAALAQQQEEALLYQMGLERSEQQFRSLFETSLDGMVILSPGSGQFIDVNPAFCRMLGYTHEELTDRSSESLTPERWHVRQREYFANVLDGSRLGVAFEQEYRCKNGLLLPVSVQITPIYDENGKLLRFWGLVRDMTHRKTAEQNARLAAAVVENAAESIMVTDAAGNIVSVNPRFTEITGYELAEVQGKNPSFLQSGIHDAEFYRALWDMLLTTGRWQGEVWDRRKDGSVFPFWNSIAVIRDNDGKISNMVAIGMDVTDRKDAESRIRHLAEHDFLTGLPNRLLFQDRINQRLLQAERHGEDFAIMFIDLDHFKDINDTMGHAAGDLLLKEVAERIVQSVRRVDTVSRQGGDEFLVLLSELSKPEDAADVAEKLMAALSKPIYLHDRKLIVTPSIGVACYPDDGMDADTLIQHADTAMYVAKDRGRNGYCFYQQDMLLLVDNRLRLTERIRTAIERNAFDIYYQPQMDLRNQQIIGAEALLRWPQPDGVEMVSPAEFIPVAEASGLIIPLGRWVLREACFHAKAWQKLYDRPLTVAVNVSLVQLAADNFCDMVAEALKDSGLPPACLEIEITESAIMNDVERMLAKMQKLNEMGVQLSIDDFGMGQSSLYRVRHFPIHKLKIDQSFVRDLLVDRDDAAVTRAIIQMGKALDLRIIAEGVEEAEQALFLSEAGCDEIQGYWLSRPIPLKLFEEMLRVKPLLVMPVPPAAE